MGIGVKYKFENENEKGLWCGYYLTNNQKTELLKQTTQQFLLPKDERLRPSELVELVRNMIKR